MIELDSLTPEDVGRSVLYVDGQGQSDEGTIHGSNQLLIFVRFKTGVMGCMPSTLYRCTKAEYRAARVQTDAIQKCVGKINGAKFAVDSSRNLIALMQEYAEEYQKELALQLAILGGHGKSEYDAAMSASKLTADEIEEARKWNAVKE